MSRSKHNLGYKETDRLGVQKCLLLGLWSIRHTYTLWAEGRIF